MVFTSKSQMARVFSESWIAEHGYCLACESNRLVPTVANTQARDFECEACRHPYELKSSSRQFGTRVVDGAFSSMMRRIESAATPSFLLMRYSSAAVLDLFAIHHSFVTPEIIEKRKPLSANARRAGWVGCNILLTGIPPEGRVTILKGGLLTSPASGRKLFQASERLTHRSIAMRSWARAVLLCLHRLPNDSFTLEQVYGFESELAKIFPANKHVREKIRQQLQVLRDASLLLFEGRGRYRLVFEP